jgi:hypothetical protein
MRVVKFAAIGFCLSIAILGTMASAPAKAGFIGETVSVDYHWPTLGSVYLSSGNAVVGAGVEFSSIGSFGPAADIADESFTITYSNTWHLSGGAAFDGLVLTAMTADIIGVSIDSNTFGFVPTLTFDGQHVYVNQAGAAFLPAGASLTVNVEFAAAEIPEPAALTIIGLGIAGLAIARRRRSI